jgi:hypothetical protein
MMLLEGVKVCLYTGSLLNLISYNKVIHTLFNALESPLYKILKCQNSKGLSQLQIKYKGINPS